MSDKAVTGLIVWLVIITFSVGVGGFFGYPVGFLAFSVGCIIILVADHFTKKWEREKPEEEPTP